MGIRYDRDRIGASKGVVIYLDDDFSLFLIKDEISRAIIHGLAYFAYRKPDEHFIHLGLSENLIMGLESPGFVISSFYPEVPFLTIPFQGKTGLKKLTQIGFSLPEKSVTREEYENELRHILSFLSGRNSGKVVAARVIVEKGQTDIAATFCELCKKFPDSYIYSFGHPSIGNWVGASPELLLKSGKDTSITTMALAGTRQTGSLDQWDEKNIKEQKMVTDYITRVMEKNGIEPFIYPATTKRAGMVEHICTEIEGKASVQLTNETLYSLLRDLSPTPALCGEPKDEALKIIKNCENFSRGFYGGFCGPYNSPEDFCLSVNVRCMAADSEKYCIYVGGGITKDSDIEKEWLETKMKSSTILNSIILNQ